MYEWRDSHTVIFMFVSCLPNQVNFLLFMNVIRILVQKLNPRLIQFNNSSQYRYMPACNRTHTHTHTHTHTEGTLAVCVEISGWFQFTLSVRWVAWWIVGLIAVRALQFESFKERILKLLFIKDTFNWSKEDFFNRFLFNKYFNKCK